MSEPKRYDPNTVNVEITGAYNSGKTTIAAVILQALLDAGFNNDNIKIVNQDNDLYAKHIAIEHITGVLKEKKITINLIDNNGNPLTE